MKTLESSYGNSILLPREINNSRKLTTILNLNWLQMKIRGKPKNLSICNKLRQFVPIAVWSFARAWKKTYTSPKVKKTKNDSLPEITVILNNFYEFHFSGYAFVRITLNKNTYSRGRNTKKIKKGKSIEPKMCQLFLNNVIKPLKHFFFRTVGWKLKPIETCITFRIRIGLIVLSFFYHKLNDLVPVAFQILKP